MTNHQPSNDITSTERSLAASQPSVAPGQSVNTDAGTGARTPNAPRISDICDLWDKPGDHERDMAGCGEGEE